MTTLAERSRKQARQEAQERKAENDMDEMRLNEMERKAKENGH